MTEEYMKKLRAFQKARDLRRKQIRATAKLLMSASLVAFGIALHWFYGNFALHEDIKRTKSLLEQTHCSVIVITPEQADALDFGARKEAGEKK
jgi:hypothetical protein